MARTGADLVIETLQAAGVKRIYGVAGDSLNGISDSLRRANTRPDTHMTITNSSSGSIRGVWKRERSAKPSTLNSARNRSGQRITGGLS